MGQEGGRPSLMKALEGIRLSKRRRRELASFLRTLRKELGVREAYFFGSRVYGTPLEDSDLDMLVVSDEFGRGSFIENMERVSRLWKGSFTIEFFPYAPQQLESYRGRKVVVTEALEKGLKVEL